MLLVVVEESKATKRKEIYKKELQIDTVYTSRSIKDAINFLKKESSAEMSIIINIVLIEELADEIEEFKQFTQEFKGIIILKVKSQDERFALNLLKENLITEFYIGKDNEKEDLDALKRSFKLAITKRKFNLISKKFEDALSSLEKKIG